MSITSPIPDENGIVHTALGEACFVCGQPLLDPALHWMTATGDIFSHDTCFLDWLPGIMRDLHELRALRKREQYSRGTTG